MNKVVRALLITILPVSMQSVHAADNPVDAIQSLTLQWTSLENQRDQLRANWRQQQPVLEQQLSLLNRERDELSSRMQETAQQQDEVEEKRLAMLEEQTRLEQEQLLLEEELRISLIDIQGLHPQLPPPLKASWDEQLPRLLNTELTSSERLQVMLDMLTALDDFRRKVTLSETLMTMEDGEDYLISQIYLGISTGWYISRDSRFAGTGYPTPSGWQWQAISDSNEISNMLAILERRRNAQLVTVPVINGGSQ